jgi:hypothetical protein
VRDPDAHASGRGGLCHGARAGRAAWRGFVAGHWVAVPADEWCGETTAPMPVPFSTSASGTPTRGAKRAASTGPMAPRTSGPQTVMVRPVAGRPALMTLSMSHRAPTRVAKFLGTQFVWSAMAFLNFGWSNSVLSKSRIGTASTVPTCFGLK